MIWSLGMFAGNRESTGESCIVGSPVSCRALANVKVSGLMRGRSKAENIINVYRDRLESKVLSILDHQHCS